MTFATEQIPRSLIKGLKLYDILYYTDWVTPIHNFVKANYPGLRAVDVECQGGGGGSGGCALTAASQASAGGGGGGGGYARSLIWADDLGTVESLVVGAPGAAAAAGANAGGVGGESAFTTISGVVQGDAGLGGAGQGAAAVAAGQARNGGNGGGGGSGTGQFVDRGQNGSCAIISLNAIPRAKGGGSHYGGGCDENQNSTGTGGTTGYNYGGGASGAFNCDAQATDRAGGQGGQGIVILWVYV